MIVMMIKRVVLPQLIFLRFLCHIFCWSFLWPCSFGNFCGPVGSGKHQCRMWTRKLWEVFGPNWSTMSNFGIVRWMKRGFNLKTFESKEGSFYYNLFTSTLISGRSRAELRSVNLFTQIKSFRPNVTPRNARKS